MSLWRKVLRRGVASDTESPADETSGNTSALPHTEHTEKTEFDVVQPGDLSLEQYTAGGLGRHLGLFSTTFLMFVVQPSSPSRMGSI